MDARKSAIFAFASKAKPLAFAGFLHPFPEFGAKNILKTITQLIQYSVLEIQFKSVKCTTVTVGYVNILSNISFLPIQATQAITVDRLNENKPLPNAFKRI